MKRKIITIVLLALLYVPVKTAHAAGTAAGTNITNKATAKYTTGGGTISTDSNTITVTVAELLNVSVTWQDASPVVVAAGGTNRIVTYKVTNTGNGSEGFALAVNTAVGGDQFDPTLASIYLDTNGNGTYDSGTDVLYTSGTNDPTLAADGSVDVFVLSNIPTGLADGNLGNVQLTATSKTGSGAAGTVLAGKGDGGVDAVIGTSGAIKTTTATYQVSNITVALNKSATVTDPFGGNKPVPGATIHYTIAATATGTGTAVGVIIVDLIPANTTYSAGTLKLNGTSLSDAKDADAGDVGGTTAGTVTVGLGDLTTSSGTKTITFDVKIN